ncbi:hypothetical protein PoB_001709600 [Plakobranchus ocellatus]|uniref:Uncharacterized protein n=1 Tax=Plakobranchus ocellatus TaxID=259542 RepID=A0AAV3YU25_9GAST|nr:hypothetical protein PoB_001709600 [Plakobranchus ocellatus]
MVAGVTITLNDCPCQAGTPRRYKFEEADRHMISSEITWFHAKENTNTTLTKIENLGLVFQCDIEKWSKQVDSIYIKQVASLAESTVPYIPGLENGKPHYRALEVAKEQLERIVIVLLWNTRPYLLGPNDGYACEASKEENRTNSTTL